MNRKAQKGDPPDEIITLILLGFHEIFELNGSAVASADGQRRAQASQERGCARISSLSQFVKPF